MISEVKDFKLSKSLSTGSKLSVGCHCHNSHVSNTSSGDVVLTMVEQWWLFSFRVSRPLVKLSRVALSWFRSLTRLWPGRHRVHSEHIKSLCCSLYRMADFLNVLSVDLVGTWEVAAHPSPLQVVDQVTSSTAGRRSLVGSTAQGPTGCRCRLLRSFERHQESGFGRLLTWSRTNRLYQCTSNESDIFIIIIQIDSFSLYLTHTNMIYYVFPI